MGSGGERRSSRVSQHPWQGVTSVPAGSPEPRPLKPTGPRLFCGRTITWGELLFPHSWSFFTALIPMSALKRAFLWFCIKCCESIIWLKGRPFLALNWVRAHSRPGAIKLAFPMTPASSPLPCGALTPGPSSLRGRAGFILGAWCPPGRGTMGARTGSPPRSIRQRNWIGSDKGPGLPGRTASPRSIAGGLTDAFTRPPPSGPPPSPLCQA